MKDAAETPSLERFAAYFLRLGASGFGGPVALAEHMHRDLVERRRWVARADYEQGLALAQLAPGPLAAQLAIYLGWVRGRIRGATVVAAAFILPSFLMVLALSALYVRFGGLSWIQGVFYGVGPAAVAVMARAALKLSRANAGRDALRWLIVAANVVVTATTGREVVWMFLGSGLLAMALGSPRSPLRLRLMSVSPALALLATGIHGPASAPTLVRLGVFFAEAGAFVFGSGLAIVPFLHGGVVEGHGWLTDRQFLDAVAVAMITPGPVVITVAFIGFLVAGLAGAVVAALAVFLPCWLLVVLPAPHYRRIAASGRLRHFIGGVTAAATGAIAGAVWVLGRRAVVDGPTAAVGIAALALVLTRKVPEPAVILLGGAAGLALRRLAGY